MKKCPRCGLDGKSIPNLFTKDRSRADGYEVYCRFCCKEKRKIKWLKHSTEYNERKRDWYRKNRDRVLSRQKRNKIINLFKGQ